MSSDLAQGGLARDVPVERDLIRVEDLKKYFPISGGILHRTAGYVRAVDGVSFTIRRGETLGLVGESGCGKSTTGRVILRLLEPTSGKVYFEGRDVFALRREDLRRLRREMQIVFQDPYASLNPRMTVADIVGEPLEVHGAAVGREKDRRVGELLEVVGLESRHGRRYPHEFSGGQRQRIGVARALALNPKFIICDEPVSALDVSIQSQVLNLLVDLQSQYGLTYLFISHDLSVIRHISDRVGIMYLGRLVEMADVREIYAHPGHPYTEALLSAIPVPRVQEERHRIVLEGDLPSPADPPPGCRFHTRCRYAMEECSRVEPPFADAGGGHFVACHLTTGERPA